MSIQNLRTPIRRFLDYLRRERNYSDYTVKSYGEDLEGWLEYTLELHRGRCPTPESITPSELRGYLSAMIEADYAKGTISRRLSALRSFFKFGVREGWRPDNPAKTLRNPKSGRRLPRFLTTDEIARLLAAPTLDQWRGIRDRAILETIYSAGLRVSELVGLNLGDLILDEGLIRVRGKGKKERFGPLGGFAVDAVNRWLSERDSVRHRARKKPADPGKEPVFLNPSGGRLTVRSVARLLDKYLKTAELDRRVSPHSLRHSFATHLLDAGADIRSIQELLGHQNLITTQIYTHVSTATLLAAYDKARAHVARSIQSPLDETERAPKRESENKSKRKPASKAEKPKKPRSKPHRPIKGEKK